MQHQFNFASLFVTHDRQEAMVLADRIAVLNGGVVRQLSAPAETYRRPQDRFVAKFIGPTNELKITSCDATTPHEENDLVAQTPMGPVHGILRFERTGDLIAIWRPEHSVLSQEEPAVVNRWQGVVEQAKFYGSEIEFSVRVGDQVFKALAHGGRVLEEGTKVWLSVEPRRMKFLNDK
jgi:ABC-type sugar transport system ATPase subunit